MATKQIGPIQFQGKLGTIVGRTTRKGYMSLGIKATSITNPQTPKQVLQRVLFAGAQRFANTTPIAAFAGFTRLAKNKKCSIRNVVTSIYGKNTEYGVDDGLPTGNKFFTIFGKGGVGVTEIKNVDYTQFVFSDGTVNYEFVEGNVKFDVPQEVQVDLSSQKDSTGSNNYIHHIIVYCPDDERWIHTTVDAAKTTAQVKVPAHWNGMKVHVWAYAQYPDEYNTNVDYSQYSTMGSQAVRAYIDSQSLFSRTQYLGSGNVG